MSGKQVVCDVENKIDTKDVSCSHSTTVTPLFALSPPPTAKIFAAFFHISLFFSADDGVCRSLACSIDYQSCLVSDASNRRIFAVRVGYKVRLEGKKGQDTRLLFCTTGILLRRLLVDRTLKVVTHVIVDEIHERGMNEGISLWLVDRTLKGHSEGV